MTRERLSAAIVLPSDLGAGFCSVRVMEGGRELEVTSLWPKPLGDF